MTKRNITSRDIEIAQRLKTIFENKKYGPERLTQAKLADRLGFEQQVSVSQYLNGRLPFRAEAIANFAAALEVDVTEIDPDFFTHLKINLNERKTRLISVTGTVTGNRPSSITIRTTIGNNVSDYAIEVDTQEYREAGLRQGCHLIIEAGVELFEDDDVYVLTHAGQRLLATYIGHSAEDNTYHLRDMKDGALLQLPAGEVRVIDLISGIEQPQKQRIQRGVRAAGDNAPQSQPSLIN